MSEGGFRELRSFLGQGCQPEVEEGGAVAGFRSDPGARPGAGGRGRPFIKAIDGRKAKALKWIGFGGKAGSLQQQQQLDKPKRDSEAKRGGFFSLEKL